MNHKSTGAKKFLEGIRVISFDVGFTLIYTEPPVGTVYAKIAGRFGYHLNGEEVHSRFRKTWKTKSSQDQQEKMHALAKEEQAYQWWKGIVRQSLGDSVNPGDVDEIARSSYSLGGMLIATKVDGSTSELASDDDRDLLPLQ